MLLIVRTKKGGKVKVKTGKVKAKTVIKQSRKWEKELAWNTLSGTQKRESKHKK